MQFYTPHSPPERSVANLVYDEARQGTVLFGGANDSTLLGDTWFFNGIDWIQQNPPISPSPRQGASMAYDAERNVSVLFGGAIGGGFLEDTWLWDGNSWIEQYPLHQPTGRANFSMAYDESRQQVILFGGQTSLVPNPIETWAWDGKDWMLLSTHRAPPEELAYGSQLVYLPELQTVMLFGDYRWKSTDPEDEIQFGEYTEVWTLAHHNFVYLPVIR